MRRAAIWLLGLVVVVVGAAFVLAPRREIVTRIDIAATPERVWAVLTDTADYPAWNPDMRLVGLLRPGQVIEHDEGQGSDRMVFHPVVLAARPAAELRWRGSLWLPGVFDAEHYLLMSAAGSGTRFIQGERCSGVALWVFDVGRLLPVFDAMNAALKKRVEAPAG